jgi:hypothetical protein
MGVQNAGQLSIFELRKREGRGMLLSTLIILESIPVVVGIPSHILNSIAYPASLNLPVLLLGILQGILLLGIWKWKKKAIYGLLVLLVVRLAPVFIILLFLLEPSDVLDTIFWGTLAVLLFELILWVWALKRKWRLFS